MTVTELPISTEEAAEMMNLKPSTLRAWRTRGQGPQYIEVSPRRVMYFRSAIIDYMKSKVVTPGGSEVGG